MRGAQINVLNKPIESTPHPPRVPLNGTIAASGLGRGSGPHVGELRPESDRPGGAFPFRSGTEPRKRGPEDGTAARRATRPRDTGLVGSTTQMSVVTGDPTRRPTTPSVTVPRPEGRDAPGGSPMPGMRERAGGRDASSNERRYGGQATGGANSSATQQSSHPIPVGPGKPNVNG